MKKRTKDQLHDIVWKDFEEMQKEESYSAMLEFTKEWIVFGGIRTRDKKRLRRYKVLLFIWWVFVGSIIITSLIPLLMNIYDNILRDQWTGVIGLFLMVFFLWVIYSINYVIKMKRDIYERYQEEVYAYFHKKLYAYFFERKEKKEDWKLELLQKFADTGALIIRDNIDPIIDYHIIDLLAHIQEFQVMTDID